MNRAIKNETRPTNPSASEDGGFTNAAAKPVQKFDGTDVKLGQGSYIKQTERDMEERIYRNYRR